MVTARSTLVNLPHGGNLPAVVTDDGENVRLVCLCFLSYGWHFSSFTFVDQNQHRGSLFCQKVIVKPQATSIGDENKRQSVPENIIKHSLMKIPLTTMGSVLSKK